jgi:hypothetical protein
MHFDELPHELQCIEGMLISAPRPEPSVVLRDRALRGMRRQFRRDTRWVRWRLAAAVAATVLVELTLSLAAVRATASVLPLRWSSPSVHEVARRVQELTPDISPEESLRRATLIQIGAVVGCRTQLGDAVGVGGGEIAQPSAFHSS